MSTSSHDDDDDLAAELDAMDIDKDFALWSSFRSRKSIASSSAASDRDLASLDTPDDSLLQEEEEDPSPLEMDDLQHWQSRLMRDEVFSHKYKPSQAEQEEFVELVKFLGMERKKLFEKEDVKWKELSELNNIVLKRGPVLCGGEERELVLLSHGFVLAKVEDPSQKTAFARMMISRTYEQCDVYGAIEYIRSVPTMVDVVIEVDENDEKVEQGVQIEMSAGEHVVLDLDEVEATSSSEVDVEDERSTELKSSNEDTKDEAEVKDASKVVAKDVNVGDKSDDESGSEERSTEKTASDDDSRDKEEEEDGNDSSDEASVESVEEGITESADSAESGRSGSKNGNDDDLKAAESADEVVDGNDSNASDSERSNDNEKEQDGSIDLKADDDEEQEAPSPPASTPERTTLFGFFGGGKKTPEKRSPKSPKKDSPSGSEDSSEVGKESESTGDKEPLSPSSSPDKRQMFSLFGGGSRKSPEKRSSSKSPLNSPKSTPEKHVTIEEPPRKKQVTIQEERHTFVIKTETDEFYFECGTKLHKEAWLEALERVLVKTRSRARSNKDRVRGWQHALVQTSLHSAAVTGLDELCCDEWLDAKNELDAYNQLAPLHYATMGNMMHIMMYLLEKGADPEVKDEDERTPMYYAQRDELVGAQSLLLDYGAKRSELCDVEERGILFQGAAQVAEEKAAKSASSKNGNRKKKSSDKVSPTDVESELKSHQQKATSAHGAMNDAMNELRIRGEKINDLADKANELEENVNMYGDLAKQLKAKAKKKKWYNL